jgi:hypothetical protein
MSFLTDESFNIFGAKTNFRVMLAGQVDLRKHVFVSNSDTLGIVRQSFVLFSSYSLARSLRISPVDRRKCPNHCPLLRERRFLRPSEE